MRKYRAKVKIKHWFWNFSICFVDKVVGIRND